MVEVLLIMASAFVLGAMFAYTVTWQVRVREHWELPPRRSFIVNLKAAGLTAIVSLLVWWVVGGLIGNGPVTKAIVTVVETIAYVIFFVDYLIKEAPKGTVLSRGRAVALTAWVSLYSLLQWVGIGAILIGGKMAFDTF